MPHAGIMLPMIDPIDDFTRPLPVGTASPIRMQFSAPEKTHTLVLMQDLLEHWMLIQSWHGLRDKRTGARTQLFDTLEAGLAALEAIASKHRKQGHALLA
jgi:hypothetical protein